MADVDAALGPERRALRSDNGYLTYMITTRWMMSGDIALDQFGIG
jgi:hypothetical protein